MTAQYLYLLEGKKFRRRHSHVGAELHFRQSGLQTACVVSGLIPSRRLVELPAVGECSHIGRRLTMVTRLLPGFGLTNH